MKQPLWHRLGRSTQAAICYTGALAVLAALIAGPYLIIGAL